MEQVIRRVLTVAVMAALGLLVAMQPLAAQQRIVIRFGTNNPVGHPVDVGARKAADIIAQRSGGRIQLQVFPGDQLGSQAEQMINTMRGTQDMWFSNPSWMAPYLATVGVLEAAYLFVDVDHMFRVMKGRIGQELFKQLPSAITIRVVDVWYLGTRHFTTNKPFRTPAELARLKIRVPNNPIYIENLRCMGGNPVPMGIGEVYLALKTGVVDGQENPFTNINAFKFYEVAKYLVLTGHQVGPIIPIIHEKTWEALGAEGQRIVVQAFEEGGKVSNALVLKDEAELLGKFKAAGMEVITPDMEAFRAQARRCLPDKFGKVWGQGVYEAIASAR
ncbi:MAG: DctP family TRAP transporter solute-binding subunit [Armatimonadota bacterium]|nr:DctP family TRAP transporter solute-binding subunit [Armatimonadota bacterium]MDR7519288.1 DctP family TRAP transporter solute-binding subunit [Armatimonadota bacterium]